MNIVISAISFTSFPKPPRTGKNSGIFLFAGALSQTSRSQRRRQPHGTRQPPAAGPARIPARIPRATPRSAEGRLRQGCSGPLSPPAALSPSLAFSKTVLATMFSSSIDELGQRRQRHCSRTSLRGAESPGDHPPAAPSALSPRASSPPAPPRCPGGGGAPRTARSAAPRYSILRPAGSPGGLRARALLPPSPGGVAPRSGPAAPRRRRPRRPGHAGTCSPGMAPPHLAPVPRPRGVPGEGRALSASGRGEHGQGTGGAGRSAPGGAVGALRRGCAGRCAELPRSRPRHSPGAALHPGPGLPLSCPRSPGLPGPALGARHPRRCPHRWEGAADTRQTCSPPAPLRPGLLAALGISKAPTKEPEGSPISPATPLASPL